jgi:hypothetical protein
MTCIHADSGCNSPEGECLGLCLKNHKFRCSVLLKAYETRPLLLTVWEYGFLKSLSICESASYSQLGTLCQIEAKAIKQGVK